MVVCDARGDVFFTNIPTGRLWAWAFADRGVRAVAGSGATRVYRDGPANPAGFLFPESLAVAAGGAVLLLTTSPAIR